MSDIVNGSSGAELAPDQAGMLRPPLVSRRATSIDPRTSLHLNRLAETEGTSAQVLCERLARESGYRAATIDLILWRACAEGIIDSRAFGKDGDGAAEANEART